MTRGVQGVSELVACHVSAEGSAVGARVTPFSALPHAVALKIFRRVPADQRARVALVCRAWRDAVADPDAWVRLNLSWKSGVSVAVTDATLRAVAARANGGLCELHVNGCDALTPAALLEVVTENADSLSTLSCLAYTNANAFKPFQEVEALARAAPQLEYFHVGAEATVEDALSMLFCNFPFAALVGGRAFLHSKGTWAV